MRTAHVSGQEVTHVLHGAYKVIPVPLGTTNDAVSLYTGLASRLVVVAVGAGFSLIVTVNGTDGDPIPVYQGFEIDSLDINGLKYTNTATGSSGSIYIEHD